MKKTALIVAALAVGAVAVAAPAEARGFRGYDGAGIGLGLAAGALVAGAYGAYGPGYGYGYGPGYCATLCLWPRGRVLRAGLLSGRTPVLPLLIERKEPGNPGFFFASRERPASRPPASMAKFLFRREADYSSRCGVAD
jgi:hypothetical protein